MKKAILMVLILLLLSGCSYNPSDEDIVDMHSKITNLESFMKFVENVNQGKEDNAPGGILRWEQEGTFVEMDSSTITKQEMIKIANSMKVAK
jgi:hypothetical protein